MQVELIYYIETGTVLSALTRAADVDDPDSVEALTHEYLALSGPNTLDSINVKYEQLNRFSFEEDDRLEQLLFNPWAFGVKDKAVVSYDKTMNFEWTSPKFKVTFTVAPAAQLKVVFLIRDHSGTHSVQRETDGITKEFFSDDFGSAKWGLVLLRGYRARGKAAS